MGEVSVGQWLVALIGLAAFIVPLWRLLPRAGIPAWVSLFGIFPFVIIVLWWVLAFRKWPDEGLRRL